jgi:hypothetical protein
MYALPPCETILGLSAAPQGLRFNPQRSHEFRERERHTVEFSSCVPQLSWDPVRMHSRLRFAMLRGPGRVRRPFGWCDFSLAYCGRSVKPACELNSGEWLRLTAPHRTTVTIHAPKCCHGQSGTSAVLTCQFTSRSLRPVDHSGLDR